MTEQNKNLLWITKKLNARFEESTNCLYVPSIYVDEERAFNRIIKVNIGYDKVNQRIILSYTNNIYTGFNLTKQKKSNYYRINLTELMRHVNIDGGTYRVTKKATELEIDLTKNYKNKETPKNEN